MEIKPRRDGAGAEPVSLIACILNEERYLAEAVARALDQDYRGPLEVVLALGPSIDRTDAVAEALVDGDERVRWVRNPDPCGATPSGLNAAIELAKHQIVIRFDGHALLPRDYVRVAVETLARTGADNVGGMMAAEGQTSFEQAVAVAMTSPIGVGAAAFHTGGAEGPADTVYLGAFRRAALERVGGYDTHFLRAQDWEMNLRLRRSGGLVWFTPAMQVTYRPRPTLRALANQYFHYGRWRRVVMRTHEGTANLRYLAPPVALVGVTAGFVLGSVGGMLLGPVGFLPLTAPAGYVLLVLVGGIAEGRRAPRSARAWLPVVLATMHLAWGLGFLTSSRRLAQ
jgi:glycosyltransferase involved in cell wall biosynthesis